MGKASRLACPAVNGNTDIDHVLDLPKELVQISVAHVEGHITDEKGFGGVVRGGAVIARARGGSACIAMTRTERVLHCDAAAFVVLLIKEGDGLGSGVDSIEFNVAESEWCD